MQKIRAMAQASAKNVRQIPSKASAKIESLFDVTKTLIYYTIVASLTYSLLLLVSGEFSTRNGKLLDFTYLNVLVFMYGTFYFAFIPAPDHEGAIHPVFVPCEKTPSKCGFLNATVAFSGRDTVLMTGQKYTVAVVLEMPESDTNR